MSSKLDGAFDSECDSEHDQEDGPAGLCVGAFRANSVRLDVITPVHLDETVQC